MLNSKFKANFTNYDLFFAVSDLWFLEISPSWFERPLKFRQIEAKKFRPVIEDDEKIVSVFDIFTSTRGKTINTLDFYWAIFPHHP